MRSFFTFVVIIGCTMSCGFLVLAADEEPEQREKIRQQGCPGAPSFKQCKLEFLKSAPVDKTKLPRDVKKE